MRRPFLAACSALALTGAAAVPGPAGAHQGNPHFRSVVRVVHPALPGLHVDVLGGDDRLELVNRTGRTVTVLGYEREPFARVLGDGTVQVNQRSPSFFLNQDRYAEGVQVPRGVTARSAPRWVLVDRTGRFDWHDHRIHYMARRTPPQVRDEDVTTRIFDWSVPLRVGAQRGSIDGRLSWIALGGGGPPAGAIVALAVLIVLGGAAVLVVRRRRVREPAA